MIFNFDLKKIKAIKPRLVLLVVCGVFFVLLVPKPVLGLTISPPRQELRADPGAILKGEFKVASELSTEATYYTSVENFSASSDESGSPTFTKDSHGLASWVDIAPSVQVKAYSDVVVPYTITVPKETEPGGYFASIFVGTTSPNADGNTIGIGSRLGTLLLVRVNGDITEGVDILEFATRGSQRLFVSLPVSLYYRFQNTGGDRVKPEGKIKIKNVLGLTTETIEANQTSGNVLPQSIRRFESTWGSGEPNSLPPGFFNKVKYQFENFALGFYKANLDITYGQGSSNSKASFWFFVLPWQLMLASLPVIIFLLFILRSLVFRYNRYVITKYLSDHKNK